MERYFTRVVYLVIVGSEIKCGLQNAYQRNGEYVYKSINADCHENISCLCLDDVLNNTNHIRFIMSKKYKNQSPVKYRQLVF